jgi:TPR repeat protein
MKWIPLLAAAALLPLHADAAVTLAADSPALTPKSPDSPVAEAIELYRQGRHTAAVQAARPLADAGDPEALFLLGYASETGNGTTRSRGNALEFYRRAALKDHLEANYRRVLILLNSDSADDRDTARKALESAVKTDPGPAARMLGEAWLKGLLGEKPDAAKAVEWWTTASDAGDTTALLLRARLHDGEFGFPEQEDDKQALALFRKAAELGDRSAYLPLGSRLLNGAEALRDEKEGRDWIDKAIQDGQTLGHLALGDFEENIRKDLKAAVGAYTLGAETGQPECMLRLALVEFSGRNGEADKDKAREWLEKAAEAGHPQAHYELAGLLAREKEPDGVKIYGHLVNAASGGIAAAQNELGMLYLSGGLGVADSPAAAAWFTRAAKAGHPAARFNLATLYERGIGVDANLNNAGELYSLAMGQGHAEATTALARLFAAGIGTEPNPVRAWALASLAVERGDDQAKQILGELSPSLTAEMLGEAKKELERLKNGGEEKKDEEK